MKSKKSWTVMVYLAADNNLTNFGIDSLKQMKAVCGDSVNILAEFYSGPRRPTKRYLFDHKTILGSIEQDVISESPAKDAGDPANLAAFVEWAATHYEAEHYFLIIWGHGAGCDDDFPRDPNISSLSDRSFVQRHRLLNSGNSGTKGRLLDAPKGTLMDAPKGNLMDAPKGVIDEAIKGVVDEASRLVFPKLTNQISIALKNVPFHLGHGKENEALLEVEILHALEKGILAAFRESVCKDLHDRILSALGVGLQGAVQRGIFNQMQRRLAGAFQSGGHDAVECLVREAVHTGSLNRLFRKVIGAMQSGSDVAALPSAPPTTIKALGFSDHPASYLTNLGLQEALRNACRSLPGGKHKLDIVGMDACDMNMVEIGYEIRDYAQYLVAAQGAVPDASWPYDSILRQLVKSPKTLPRDLACTTATTYVLNYRDYVDQPVALSVLDLEESGQVQRLFKEFTTAMEKSLTNAGMRQAILAARRKARSFGQNQFVDVMDFCQHLAEEPGSQDAGRVALSLIGQFQPFIAYNESGDEPGCNGTSIYFPEFDPANFEHQDDLAALYGKLDFAQQTGWGRFVAEFLKQQTREWKAAIIAQETLREAALAMKAAKAKKPGMEPLPHDEILVHGATNNHGISLR
ncbi:MAG TPA: clostripain-related cysteine peptidase [Candidatus Angelobacter sp.]|jgi:hypothetical protein|nr:clostripain-related cysteine peptidase [Candidatus Angelobacter sp.]